MELIETNRILCTLSVLLILLQLHLISRVGEDFDGGNNGNRYRGQNVTTTIEKSNTTHIDATMAIDHTDRSKNVVATRLRLMGTSPDIIETINKVNISIVISHCKENISWIAEYIGDKFLTIKDITIYSKCGKEVEGRINLEEGLGVPPTSINLVMLPNVGRCDHTYAHWINEQYKSINEQSSGNTNANDIVMFFKDTDRYRNKYLPIDLLFTHASKSGFGCIMKPKCHCNVGCENKLHTPLMQHRRESMEKFTIHDYDRTGTDENKSFLSQHYLVLKDWRDEMGFTIPQSETIPVCYGGQFIAQKKQILNQPKLSWQKMESSLSRGDNIIEGHYAERLWASILSDVDDESARAVDEALSPYMATMVGEAKKECGMLGMLFIRKDAQIVLP